MAFKILAIDGGGIRGLYAAYILKRIHEELGIVFSKHFDLIIGTSTGSIIASALAINYPIEKVVMLYEVEGKKIFSPNSFSLNGLYKSKYSRRYLEKILNKALGNKTLSDVQDTRLVIPATDIANGQVFVFKSSYLDEFIRDKNTKIVDAILASCSAPTYFDPSRVDNYLLVDGGLWANNPALVGLIEAIGKLKIDKDQVKILSVGTGIGHRYYEIDGAEDRKWGLSNGWQGSKLVDTILNLQSISSENMVKLVLRDDQYLRLNFNSDVKLAMDSLSILDSLKSKADQTFTYQINNIQSFLA
ncbi:patatin [Leptolyngbya boryana NIES-2135]|jgi:patatin-like phospholipase/acyl hydrolase|uniref:Patatin n=1 Tax=Leptolyngbya boryana NIES-2135 TaxID=1973484 RepID=A0A1Z4JPI4_LEPBY|nr:MULTISPECIES: CBASS cGAMP-activated phospholipase [Leptolyngbya]BAY58620.1 patatin [Leptolyngbya boryana NIES-2135]MBD2370706.1 patatin-like phospholipase family protein [Leptolyngbya sp. FACHB-161]MBD2377141.1 patatin-like phospholipase family protein [Leptolyngbya sp. FACHB-238]MBD2401584.1 patatin-like phospholipase family protein [Leptolyngbya sp. FACHB-239]MBD2408136.1 patatin-like phospholipase family protein [Leptolyngbya sp. FACHB-402]